jgi:putative addiction module component (TIGR02574 family)
MLGTAHWVLAGVPPNQERGVKDACSGIRHSPEFGPPSGVRLAELLWLTQISPMNSPIFDFSHLSPEERIQLAEDLWDSLAPGDLPLAEDLGAELDRRLEQHRKDPGRGRPPDDVLRDIEQRGR